MGACLACIYAVRMAPRVPAEKPVRTPSERGGPCLRAREAADHLRANAGGTLVCHRAYWAGTAQVPRQALGKVGAQRLVPPMVHLGRRGKPRRLMRLR
jgi:hypothetical protein